MASAPEKNFDRLDIESARSVDYDKGVDDLFYKSKQGLHEFITPTDDNEIFIAKLLEWANKLSYPHIFEHCKADEDCMDSEKLVQKLTEIFNEIGLFVDQEKEQIFRDALIKKEIFIGKLQQGMQDLAKIYSDGNFDGEKKFLEGIGQYSVSTAKAEAAKKESAIPESLSAAHQKASSKIPSSLPKSGNVVQIDEARRERLFSVVTDIGLAEALGEFTNDEVAEAFSPIVIGIALKKIIKLLGSEKIKAQLNAQIRKDSSPEHREKFAYKLSIVAIKELREEKDNDAPIAACIPFFFKPENSAYLANLREAIYDKVNAHLTMIYRNPKSIAPPASSHKPAPVIIPKAPPAPRIFNIDLKKVFGTDSVLSPNVPVDTVPAANQTTTQTTDAPAVIDDEVTQVSEKPITDSVSAQTAPKLTTAEDVKRAVRNLPNAIADVPAAEQKGNSQQGPYREAPPIEPEPIPQTFSAAVEKNPISGIQQAPYIPSPAPAPKQSGWKRAGKWLAGAAFAVAGAMGIYSVAEYSKSHDTSNSNAVASSSASTKNNAEAPSAVPVATNLPTEKTIAPPVVEIKSSQPDPIAVHSASEIFTESNVLASENYANGSSTMKDSAVNAEHFQDKSQAKPMGVKGGVDATPFDPGIKMNAAEYHIQEMQLAESKIEAAHLMDMYDHNPSRLGPSVIAFVKSHENILRDIQAFPNNNPTQFRQQFGRKYNAADVFGANGALNGLLAYERAERFISGTGPTAVNFAKDTTMIQIEFGNDINNSKQRFAKAYAPKTASAPTPINAPAPTLKAPTDPNQSTDPGDQNKHGYYKAPQKLMDQMNPGNIPTNIALQGSTFAVNNFELDEIDKGWDELLDAQSPTHAPTIETTYEEIDAQELAELEMAEIDAGWDVITREHESLSKPQLASEKAKILRDGDLNFVA